MARWLLVALLVASCRFDEAGVDDSLDGGSTVDGTLPDARADAPADTMVDASCGRASVTVAGVPATSGEVVTNPREIVMTNGTVTVTYEFLNDQQQGAHSLYLGDDRVTGYKYGDYTYWVSTVDDPAVDATIVAARPDYVEVAFRFEHDVQGPYAGTLGTIELVKHVALIGDHPGMFVRFSSDPPTEVGEREIGLGALSSMAFSSAGVVANHPSDGGHVDLGLLGQSNGPWWAAGLPDHVPGIITYFVLAEPMWTLSYQFSPSQSGYPTVNQLQPARTSAYQVFIGALAHTSADAAVLTAVIDQMAPDITNALAAGPPSVCGP